MVIEDVDCRFENGISTLIFVDEDDITENARFFVSEALRFRDHSRLSGGQ